MASFNFKAFSLVELMVAVAILGIVSAVAIPKFNNFVRKSRQAEAKVNLGAVYTSENIFFQEWGTYYADLAEIGHTSPSGILIYAVGFRATDFNFLQLRAIHGYTGTPTFFLGLQTTSSLCRFSGLCEIGPIGAPRRVGYPRATPAIFTASCGVWARGASRATEFEAQASGWIGGMQLDRWAINQQKQLLNQQNGTL